MTDTDAPRAVVRITLAFGAAAPDLDALDALAGLAAALRAELSGLFVEDQDLLRLAALPVAREYFGSGAPRSIEIADMERQLKRQADLLRAALMLRAERAGARWTFATTRGSFARELGIRSLQSQLVAVGLSRRSRGPFREPNTRRAIAIVYSGGAASRRAVELAQRLRDVLGRPLLLLIPARSQDEADGLAAEAQPLLTAPPAKVLTVTDTSLAGLVLATRTLSPALLLLEANDGLMTSEAIAFMNEESPCPALLVR